MSWDPEVVVKKIIEPVSIAGNVSIGNLSVSNVVVSEIQRPVEIFGNVGIDGNAFVLSNVVISNVLTPVEVYGNVGLIGNVDFSNVTIANVLTPVEIYGNVGLIGNVDFSNVTIANVLTPVEVYGNVVVSNVSTPVQVYGNVVVSNISSPVEVYGNVGFTGNLLVSNINFSNVSISNIAEPVTISRIIETASARLPEYADTFGRLRVTNPTTVLSSVRIGSTPYSMMTEGVSGNARIIKDTGNSTTTILIVDNGSAVWQTRARSIYQAGKSVITVQKFKFGKRQDNSIQLVGHFDARDGLLLKMQGDGAHVERRCNGDVAEAYRQEEWNIDRLDGTGPSGIVANFELVQTFVTDMDWLSGKAKVGFDFGGTTVAVHEFENSNNVEGSKIFNPNLPLRVEVSAPAANGLNMDYYGGTAMMNLGYFLSAGRSRCYSGTSTCLAGNTTEILALRMKSAYVDCSSFKISKVSACALTPGGFGTVTLRVNPNASTSVSPWQSIGEDSVLERFGGSDREVVEGTGYAVSGGFATNFSAIVAEIPENGAKGMLGASVDRTSDVASISVERGTSSLTECDFAYTVEWVEYY